MASFPLVFSVTSGKGGVGKTNVSVNLAHALAKRGKRVLILDADLGLANVDVLLGLTPRRNLFHLFHEGVGVRDILVQTPYGFSILPASSGITEMLELDTGQKLELLEAMDFLEEQLDYLIVDTGAGISDSVLYFNLAVQEKLLVLTPDPTSLTDAYALVKVLNQQHGIDRFKVLVNMAPTREAARDVFVKLYRACDQFLSGISLDMVGTVPFDPAVKQAVIRQEPFCHLYAESEAAKGLMASAENVLTWEPAAGLDGNIKFFWKKILFQGESVA